jgi:hypothetical protein
MAPLGRGIAFAFGNGWGGSAGSFATECCAAGCSWAEAIAEIKNREPHATSIRMFFIFCP